MHRYPTFLSLISAVMLCSVVIPTHARAAEPDDRWHFSITPYIWVPFVDTSIDFPDLSGIVGGDTSNSFSDIDLDFALMGSAEVSKGRFALLFDGEYVSLSQDYSRQFGNNGSINEDLELKIYSVSVAGAYTFAVGEKYSAGVVAGARLLHADIGLDLDTSGGASFNVDSDSTIIDPIIGLRGHWRFAKKWSLVGYGDIGGFGVGSDLTWQALGAVGYHFNDHFALLAGWRAYGYEFDVDDTEVDLLLHGPAVGLQIRF